MRILSFIILAAIISTLEIFGQSPHGDLKGLDCANCHESTNWKIASSKNKFDHVKTGFVLTGQHRVVNCSSCHIELKFSNVKSDCNSCHKDVHQNTTNSDCSNCHKPDSWLIANRNELHQKSRFPLIGSHLKADCIQCHSGYSNLNFATLGINCIDCHQSDYQATQNPNHTQAGFSTNCLDCHSMLQDKWSAEIFAHNFFPLIGGHKIQNCFSCHQTGGDFKGLSTDCYSCHQNSYAAAINPPHASNNFPTNCKQCHTIQGWKPASFDHNSTQFPLTGAHINTNCANCHQNGYVSTSTSCVSCHQTNFNSTTNPNHLALSIPTDCQSCHTTNPGWKPSTFSIHNNFYQLIGAHAQIANNCSSCHNGNYNNTPNTCYGCHATDYNTVTNPPHASAGFNTDCQSCHSQNAWKPATWDHDGQFFPIYSGKHKGKWNTCSECHTVQTNFSVFSCIDCHEHRKTEMDSEHQGISGYIYASNECYSCHPRGTKDGAFNHAISAFPLTGAHQTVDCSQCHQNGYANTTTICYDCHQSQFNNSTNPNHQALVISTECTSCHTTNSGWKPALFPQHDNYFALTGAHAAISTNCAQCHNGNYTTISNTCISCHQTDYNSAQNHLAQGYPTDCEMCHNSVAWNQTTFNHNNTNFQLTGAHISVECSHCHSNGFTNTSTECSSCHNSNFNSTTNPNHVTLNLSNQCQSCHTTNPGWKPATFSIHNNFFQLIGAHAAIQNNCSNCHNGNYNNTPNTCYGCHTNDYNSTTDPPHLTSQFPTDCLPCHSQNAWTPATFNHDGPYFPIYSGKHKNKWTKCSDCHTNPANYTIFSCIDCHEHRKSKMDEEHQGVSGYVYASAACYDCHPRGNSLRPLERTIQKVN